MAGESSTFAGGRTMDDRFGDVERRGTPMRMRDFHEGKKYGMMAKDESKNRRHQGKKKIGAPRKRVIPGANNPAGRRRMGMRGPSRRKKNLTEGRQSFDTAKRKKGTIRGVGTAEIFQYLKKESRPTEGDIVSCAMGGPRGVT